MASYYRPVDVRLWNDRKFLALGDDARAVWVFLLTCPSLPIPGVIVGGEAALAEQLGWGTERFRQGFAEVVRGGLKVVREGRLVWLPNALKYQPPAGPNALKGWAKKWDDVPEGEMKLALWQALKIASKSWATLFSKLFQEPSRTTSDMGTATRSIHEHEHEHEHEQDTDPPPARAIPPVVAEPYAQAAQPEPDLRPPTRLPVAWSGPPDHRALAQRQALAKDIRDAVNAARERASKAIPGARYRPLDAQDPGERSLAAYIVCAPKLEDARETLLHVVEMAETEAIAKKGLQWLTLSAIFSEKNRTRFAGGTKAEFARPDPRGPDIAAIRATPDEMVTARAVLEQLSEGSSKGPAPIVWRVEDGHAAIVVQRLREIEAVRPGYGHAELCAVAAVACDAFEGQDRTRKLLTPGFVFGPAKFAELLTTARATYAANIEERTAERAAERRKAAP